jgi:hypothetical protein
MGRQQKLAKERKKMIPIPPKGIILSDMTKYAKKKYLDSFRTPDPNVTAFIQALKKNPNSPLPVVQQTNSIQHTHVANNCIDHDIVSDVDTGPNYALDFDEGGVSYYGDEIEEAGQSDLQIYKQKLADEEQAKERERTDEHWNEKEAAKKQKRRDNAKENEEWWICIQDNVHIAYKTFLVELRENEVAPITKPTCTCVECPKKEVYFLCLRSGLTKLELCNADEDQLVSVK